jgi:glycosyltransferase involved in cell wall biosynthesis
MRITLLNGLYPPNGAGGAETTLRLLAAQLSERGHVCSILTLTPSLHAAKATVDGVEVRYLPLANFYWPYKEPRPRSLRPLFHAADMFNPVMARQVRHNLQELRPDVVNCHNLLGFSASAWAAAASLRLPIVQTIHDYYIACPRSTMWRPQRGNCGTPCLECRVFSKPRRALSRLPDAVTCVSHRVFDRLSAAGAFRGATRGRQPVRIIRGNNVHTTAAGPAPPSPAGANGAVGERRLTLGFMARLEPSKGLENLLDAIAGLPVQLLIAGSGAAAYESGLRARCPQDARAEFLGHTSPAAFFPRIDLLVIPSQWEDPFPRVFNEALAYGIPSLVPPRGGLPEVVQSGRNGFIASGTDAASLRADLRSLLAGGFDRGPMRRATLASAQLYAPDRIVSQYEAVLSAVAARRPVPDDAGEVWREGAPQAAGCIRS